MSFKTASRIFDGISEDNLCKIVRQEGIPMEESTKRSQLVDQLSLKVEEVGVKQITSLLSQVQLEEIVAPLKIDHDVNNPKHKVVLRKRLVERIMKEGVQEFMSEYMDEAKLQEFVRVLQEVPVSDKKKELVTQVTRLVHGVGIQTFLNRFDTPFLKVIMKDLKLKCTTESKNKIVLAIATQTSARTETVSKDPIIFSKSKKPIKQGLSYQDIFQHYNLEELVEWCRENELKVSGTKPEVIRRILSFLDGDKENTMAKPTNSPKKPEMKETKKETKKDMPKKQKAPEPEEEEEEEQEHEHEQEEQEEESEEEKPLSKSSKKSSKETVSKPEVEETKEEEEEEEEEIRKVSKKSSKQKSSSKN